MLLFFPAGGLLAPRDSSDHKVYILREKREKKNTTTMFQPLLTDPLFFFIIDQLFLIWIQRFWVFVLDFFLVVNKTPVTE